MALRKPCATAGLTDVLTVYWYYMGTRLSLGDFIKICSLNQKPTDECLIPSSFLLCHFHTLPVLDFITSNVTL